MTGQPQNPFANLPTSGQLQVGGQGGGANPPSGSGDRRAINRFTKLEFSGTAMDLFGIKLINIIGAVLDNSELGYHGEHEKVTDKSG